MKRTLILLLFILYSTVNASAQKKYICEFSDSVITILPDSFLKEMSKTVNLQGAELTPELVEQIFTQLKTKPLSMYQLRTITATKDGTVAKIDRSSRDGNTMRETFDSLLYKDDEIYMDSVSISGCASKPIQRTRKEFNPTGNSKIISNYKCTEYLSTDSTCYIWVTTELPDYINPGIRKGKVKGAVLGFELKTEMTINKCELIRFGRSL